ncbi:MAG: phycobilisome rod-core linker polypeptide [Nitrospira defluvii]|nr:phycobilisome rod-core linker polypeptide [Nitrospira defluvii]
MSPLKRRTLCALALVAWVGSSTLYLRDVQAAKEWAPQEVATILTQSYGQLLMRPVVVESSISQRNEADQKRAAVQPTYGEQLLKGEKSVKQIVEAIALSPEFNAKWITPHMGTAQIGPAPGVAPVAAPEKAIDNLYCALLGRPVDSASLATARRDLVSSGFERVIRDLIDGKEYRDRFGDSKVPQPIGEKQIAAGCPQGIL